MSVITVRSNIKDYDVVFENDPGFLNFSSKFQEACYIIDTNVWDLYKDSVLSVLPEQDVIILPFDETRKNLATVQEIYDRLMVRSSKRNLTLVSIGGGITQDVTGFAASTLYRGLHWIFVPTTLLAQSDSCIGGKTSLNYQTYKNLVGTFYPPSRVHLYTPFLSTLKDVDYASGLGEVIKLYLMGGRERSEALPGLLGPLLARQPEVLRQSVRESLLVKISFIEGDEFDTGRRNLLNFGHTLGHALESVSNYRVPHGQAILVGMAFANIVSSRRGLLASTRNTAIAGILEQALVCRPMPAEMDAALLIEAMRKDKKRVGTNIPLVMLTDDGSLVRINDLTEEEAHIALRALGIWLFGN
ncbi:3-dehydroquinate synthase [Desulfovibrio sp. TomC]|uniref:3-dehydroquinate synthase n=1 Tax=Desulfovibrio sp. TomC TaxID=1562888 RepID=UPI000575817F|nr:3-dehydroquinate synthase family protein [Desulfovibrio sp. TomC]KHK00163.1 3-dehydroquinate synthase [Desulfovibrio sp. TomC]